MIKQAFKSVSFNTKAQLKKLCIGILCAGLLGSGTLLAQDSAVEAYSLGQEALKQNKWQRAAEHFATAAKTDNANTDSALYWQAYALSRGGQDQQVQKPLNRLLANYPDSPWHDDAEILLFENSHQLQQMDVDQVKDIEASELRLYALSVLMERHPKRALPMAKDMLSKSTDTDTKEQILFLLSSSNDAEAKAIIRDIALNNREPELRETAIYLFADSGSKEDLDTLFQAYNSLNNDDAKESIIYALGNNDAQAYLSQILHAEKNSDLQASVIYALSNMDAFDELLSLDLASLTQDAQEALIYSYAQNSSMDERNLKELESIYRNTTNDSLKETIIYAFSHDHQNEFLLNVLRDETDPDLQAAAIYSLKDSDASQELLKLDIQKLQEDAREALIYAYAEMGETDRLHSLLDTETDSDTRTVIIYSMANSDEPNASKALMDIYRNTSSDEDEREAALHALMQRDETDLLIDLLQEEKNPELKVMILRAVASSDDPKVQAALFEILEK